MRGKVETHRAYVENEDKVQTEKIQKRKITKERNRNTGKKGACTV